MSVLSQRASSMDQSGHCLFLPGGGDTLSVTYIEPSCLNVAGGSCRGCVYIPMSVLSACNGDYRECAVLWVWDRFT